ncbi:MAG: hypothetical protein LBJ00_01620 [Planctomycetaceae bacterium]|nr:hypothetical protein [Planctomycetaceae bacterium]
MNNRFAMLRLPNALRCRFTAASGISKQLEYTANQPRSKNSRRLPIADTLSRNHNSMNTSPRFNYFRTGEGGL